MAIEEQRLLPNSEDKGTTGRGGHGGRLGNNGVRVHLRHNSVFDNRENLKDFIEVACR
ncbi:hypothetical protein Hanom_Chr11g01020301 [Helianthus anomalus]